MRKTHTARYCGTGHVPGRVVMREVRRRLWNVLGTPEELVSGSRVHQSEPRVFQGLVERPET